MSDRVQGHLLKDFITVHCDKCKATTQVEDYQKVVRGGCEGHYQYPGETTWCYVYLYDCNMCGVESYAEDF